MTAGATVITIRARRHDSDDPYLVVAADSREDQAPMTFEDAKPALLKVVEDEQRQQLFYDWFTKRLGEAPVKISAHYGRWDRANQLVT